MTRAEMRAEELVFEMAEELGLTEDEVLALDPLAVVDGVLRDLRAELARQLGRNPDGAPAPRLLRAHATQLRT